MMQPFRISDALRCSLLNSPKGPNLACPSNGSSNPWLQQRAVLWKQALTQRQDRIILAWWIGIRLGGLVAARTCAGGRVWEVDHLYLPAFDADTPPTDNGRSLSFDGDSLELFERLILTAGDRCAERMFLRLPAGSPVIHLARRAGFFPCYEEDLFEGKVSQDARNGEAPPLNLRSLLPSDEHSLFLLFNAATPASVRCALGLTFDQWRDAREVCGSTGPEWVTESKGRITSWLSASSGARGDPGRLLVHPDHSDLAGGLLKLAHNSLGTNKWLLADYQQTIAQHLQELEFQPTAEYTILVKTVAAPAMNPGMVQVGA